MLFYTSCLSPRKHQINPTYYNKKLIKNQIIISSKTVPARLTWFHNSFSNCTDIKMCFLSVWCLTWILEISDRGMWFYLSGSVLRLEWCYCVVVWACITISHCLDTKCMQLKYFVLMISILLVACVLPKLFLLYKPKRYFGV